MNLKSMLVLCASLTLFSTGSALAQQRRQQPPPPPVVPPDTNVGTLRGFPIIPPDVEGGNFLGIYSEDVDRENMTRYGLREPRGVGITRVIEASPAARAGLKKDDVILRFDNEAVTSVRKLTRLITEAAPEHTVKLTINRAGAEQEISVQLAARREVSGTLEDMLRRDRSDVLRNRNDGQRDRETFTMNFGPSRRIGVTTAALTEQLADYFSISGRQGLLVTSVVENSPAAKAGLKAGDVITEVDSAKVVASGDLSRAINRRNEGEITLTFVRDKNQRTIKLTPERTETNDFDFSPNIRFTPQIGNVTIPRVVLPTMMRSNRIVVPRILITTPVLPPVLPLPSIRRLPCPL